jgi:hypothetical protein
MANLAFPLPVSCVSQGKSERQSSHDIATTDNAQRAKSEHALNSAKSLIGRAGGPVLA